MARVPLIISYGKQIEPKRIQGMTEAVDLLPTILSLLDVSIPGGIRPDGTDLSELSRQGTGRTHVLMYKGIRSSTHKLLIDNWRIALRDDGTFPVETLRGQLYDLAEDPQELTNVWWTDPKRVGELAETYREGMRHRFDRFQNAVTNEQPRSAFAIAAKGFDVTPEPLQVSTPLDREAYRMSMRKERWVLSSHWEEFGLLGNAEVSPSKIRIAIPNGVYNVSVAMAGQCTVLVGGLDAMAVLKGLAVSPTGETKCRPLEIGEIAIQNESFEATLRPTVGEDWLLLKYVGFEPVIEGAQQLDREALDRLRALGYLN
jgi:hypothetical protein